MQLIENFLKIDKQTFQELQVLTVQVDFNEKDIGEKFEELLTRVKSMAQRIEVI